MMPTWGQDESIFKLPLDDLLQKTIERGGEVHWQFTELEAKKEEHEYSGLLEMTNPYLRVFSYGRAIAQLGLGLGVIQTARNC